MNLVKIAFAVLLLLCRPQCAQATNLWFMPGDACFPAVLDQKFAEQLQESKPAIRIDFSNLGGGGYFCGYAGYHTIEIFPPLGRPRFKEFIAPYVIFRRGGSNKNLISTAKSNKKSKPTDF